MKVGEIVGDARDSIQESIRLRCSRSAGPMDGNFLCSSLSLLNPAAPVLVPDTTSLHDVMTTLRDIRSGCVVVIQDDGKIAGIFSERDYVIKIYARDIDHSGPVSKYMTKNPVCVSLDETMAYALTLMSQGGFRNLPVVDGDQNPIGIVSVKDIVDYLSGRVLDDLLEEEF